MTDRAEPPAANVRLRIGDRTFPIEPDRIHVIGSGPRADIRLDDADLAPAHATFCTHDGRMILEDLGGESGIWVGAVRVRGECELPPGTLVRIGRHFCVVEVIEAPAVVSGPAASPDPEPTGGPTDVVDPVPPDPAAGPPERVTRVAIRLSAPPPPEAPAGRRGRGGRTDAPIRRGEPEFRELMADELRRAPWFGLSLTLHALLLFLLWLLVPRPEYGTRNPPEVQLGSMNAPASELDGDDEPPPLDDPDPLDEPLPMPGAADDTFDAPVEEPAELRSAPTFAESMLSGGELMLAPLGGATGDILSAAGNGKLADGFRREIAGLRESGLEIVFVFDSTGSMGPVLDATRRRMIRMLEALRALVPDARVGIVTFRDRGRREDYVVRQTPLGRDFYRTLAFMETVQAAGGGDRPEAVMEGLQAAIRQDWKAGSRRVVVLIGDAPDHAEDRPKLIREVNRFIDDGRSSVHAIMTAPDAFRGIEADTRRAFETIAEAGGGVSLPFEREERILDQVLTLAIGRQFRAAVDDVFRALERRSARERATPRYTLERIRSELRKSSPNDRFVESLARSRDLETAQELIRTLTAREVPPAARHAASWALMSILKLRDPPLPPDQDEPIDRDRAEVFRTRALFLAERKELIAPEEPPAAPGSRARDGTRSASGAPTRARDRRRD